MADPRINLRSRSLAAVLAFLIPGAGHWYQRRYFKAAIYSICILSTFYWGQVLADWKGVYFRWEDIEERRFQTRERTIGYLSQFLTGLPSMPGLFQWHRYSSSGDARAPLPLDLPLDTAFQGYAKIDNPQGESWEGPITGRVQLSLDESEAQGFGTQIQGHFRGRLEGDAARDIEFDLGGSLSIGNRVGSQTIGPRVLGSGEITRTLDGKNSPKEFSSSRRFLACRIVVARGEFEAPVGEIEGTIPRAFWDWYQVPLEEDAIQDMNRRLGKRYEIALLFTWVAGLLNLLAIWDAYEGPAYGYGDEVDQPEGQPANAAPATTVAASLPAQAPTAAVTATPVPSSG
ncbi:MAG: DUF6677 family protein [Planctomycetaceae bacterium]